MTKTRLEAFSDGVIAIIITIMVLELKIPHSTNWEDIKPLFPTFISYVISFIMIGIYWGNHHHLLHTVNHVNSKMIWANLHLLFWLSLVPFATAWMGETRFDKIT
ncbi:MAG: TMEM175 family protein, partial [Bacteroidia bacterium]